MEHCLKLIEKNHSTLVEVIDGWLLALGNIMEETQCLDVMLGDQVPHVVFNIIQCLANLVVLVFHGLNYIIPMLIGTYGGFL